jgi:hypothetical protein
MTRLIDIADPEDWFEIDLDSAILVDVGHLAVSQIFVERLANTRPSVVSFFGSESEAWHDAFDEVIAREKQEPITTWHDDESESEVLWEFLNVHVPHSLGSGGIYVMGIGSTRLLEWARRVEANSSVK